MLLGKPGFLRGVRVLLHHRRLVVVPSKQWSHLTAVTQVGWLEDRNLHRLGWWRHECGCRCVCQGPPQLAVDETVMWLTLSLHHY